MEEIGEEKAMEEWIKKNPKKMAMTVKSLTKEELSKLGALELDIRNGAILFSFLNSGLRVSELCGLKFDDVYYGSDVKNGISVSAEIAKGGQPREIPISDRLRQMFKDYFKWVYEQSNTMPSSSRPLFTSSKAGINPISVRQVQHIVRAIGVQIGLPDLHPHMLRHTYLTGLQDKCGNIRIVQIVAGHRSLQSTQIYLHPSTDDLRTAVNKL